MEGQNTRTNADEVAERVELTRKMLAARAVKSDIKRALKAKYGVSARTCESYLSRARALLVAETNRSKEDHVCDSYSLYASIASDPNQRAQWRMKAQERIDKLLGLELPQKLAQTDTAGNDLTPEQRDLHIEALWEQYGGRFTQDSGELN